MKMQCYALIYINALGFALLSVRMLGRMARALQAAIEQTRHLKGMEEKSCS
jgi:hypothetical protein